MLISCCPTCGTLLADKQIFFEKEKRNNNIEKKNDYENIMKKLKIRRYCCKLRIITYYDDSKNLI